MTDHHAGVLAGRVAIVTGGASGIGEAIARRFAREGAAVAIVDQHATAADAAAARLRAAGGDVAAFELDVSHVERHGALLELVEERFGTVGILVNNAGIGPHASFLATTPELWDRVHAVNVRGSVFLMQRVAERLIAAGRPGSIINVTSVVVERPWLQNTAYAAAKGALAKVGEYAAAELGPHGIRVNSLAPGPTDTPLSASAYRDPAFREQLLAAIPLRRIGTPDDLADAALFLASDASAFTTGQTLHVDGGRRIG